MDNVASDAARVAFSNWFVVEGAATIACLALIACAEWSVRAKLSAAAGTVATAVQLIWFIAILKFEVATGEFSAVRSEMHLRVAFLALILVNIAVAYGSVSHRVKVR